LNKIVLFDSIFEVAILKMLEFIIAGLSN
jgi:hypothetical protein